MKFYCEGNFLFIDMKHRYQFAVMEGDRVITCQKERVQAEATADELRRARRKNIEALKNGLCRDPAQNREGDKVFGRAIHELYPSDGLIYGAIRRQQAAHDSIRVVPLTVTE